MPSALAHLSFILDVQAFQASPPATPLLPTGSTTYRCAKALGMHQRRHTFAQRNRRIIRQNFCVPPQRARAALQVLKRKRGGRPLQVVPRQQWLPARAQVLLYRRIIFLATSGALQLNHIQRFCHHRESLAHAFFGRDQFGWSSFPSPFPPRLGSHSFRSMIPKYSPDRLPISRKREPYLTRLRR